MASHVGGVRVVKGGVWESPTLLNHLIKTAIFTKLIIGSTYNTLRIRINDK